MSNYEELAYDILNYANGLPLAVKALGSFLFGRDISEWRSALARLREIPNKDIMDVLRSSYDGLEETEKEIFLDIACFFNGLEEKYVKNVLDCCGFHPEIGLRVLIDKSLISISDKSRIEMHGLLEELGRKIIQENSTKETRTWSRLWLHENFNNVISDNKEKKVEAIGLRHGHQRGPKKLMAEALSKMRHLRLLILEGVDFLGSLNYLSNELRYIEWHRYPFMYLPSSFQPNKLVELYLVDSNIKQLWEGTKYLPSLKTLELKHSKNLIKIPDFREVPNLKWLDLKGCVKLEQIDPRIGVLEKLVHLNLKDCHSLVNIPNDIFGLPSLEYLNLFGCNYAFNNSVPLHMVKESSESATSQSHSSIFKWITSPFRSNVGTGTELYNNCIPICLPPSLQFHSLRKLDISYCGVSQVPNAIGCLHWLERLVLRGNNFVTVPSLRELSRLTYLNLGHCKRLKSLPELPDRYVFPNSGYSKSAILCLFNCPELGETDSSAIFSWMIRIIKANQEVSSPALFRRVDIVIPGREIPRWFNNKIVGQSSIKIDPWTIVHDGDELRLSLGISTRFGTTQRTHDESRKNL